MIAMDLDSHNQSRLTLHTAAGRLFLFAGRINLRLIMSYDCDSLLHKALSGGEIDDPRKSILNAETPRRRGKTGLLARQGQPLWQRNFCKRIIRDDE